MKYDYREAMRHDIEEYINENIILNCYDNREHLETVLYDYLWTEDSVTGNGSGSYTFNAYKAEEYICHNLDLVMTALREFGCHIGEGAKLLDKGAEFFDVTVRCWLLGEVLHEVLDSMDLPYDEEDA